MPELPISLAQARRATRWLMTHFGGRLTAAANGPLTPALFCGIACQETAYFWLSLVNKVSPEELIARCVLDASGDAPKSSRSAFPRNTAAFYAKYDRAFGDMLVAEANATRRLRGMDPRPWIYKGYGIFQYDLQFVENDEDYFRFRRWRDFDACLQRVVKELLGNLRRNGGDLWEAVRAYNGSGAAARAYRDNVRQFTAAAEAEIGALAGIAPSPVPTAGAGASRGGPGGPGGGARGAAASKSRKKKAPAARKNASPPEFFTLPAKPASRGPAPRGGAMLPPARPRMTAAEMAERLAPFQLDRAKHPLVVVGIRGYYRDSMGLPGVNDRGIYDDALFIDAPDTFTAFNGNTDPSVFRPGEGFSEKTRGIASLVPGAWFVHKFDLHRGKYLALCQRAGPVDVMRDGKKEPYRHRGEFGINIHRGSYQGTSSLGCQTLHPDQWDAFIQLATDLARRYHGDRWRKVVIPYVLMDAPSA